MKIVPLVVRVLVVGSQEISPLTVLHLYAVFGVRFATPWLSFLKASLSASLSDIAATGLSNLNTGSAGSPGCWALQPKYGPGLAFRYQPSQSTVGGEMTGTVLLRIVA